ncbi:DUF3085 domain-containing protein [Streptomyces sp. 372A]
MTNPATPTTPEDFDALLRNVLGENNQPPAPLDCILTFPLDQVRSAAQHASTATEHALGPDDHDAHPRLWLIKGDGIFLMSNGINHKPNTRDPKGGWRHIVFADNWGPGTNPSTVLGDDLHETLDLTHPVDDGPTLIELLREHPTHATRFLLHLSHDNEGLTLTMTTE